MFAQRRGAPDAERDVPVDSALEWDISAVEQAVEGYLQGQGESLRKELLEALAVLDDQIECGDAYHAQLRMYGPQSSVVGATSPGSLVQELPASEFQAQVALVKAAKNAVTRLTPENLADLQAANDSLSAWRN